MKGSLTSIRHLSLSWAEPDESNSCSISNYAQVISSDFQHNDLYAHLISHPLPK